MSHGSHQYVQYRDGYLIVSTENGITCLDADSGTVLWDIDTLPVADAPVYHAGSLLMGVERNTVVDLLCIDLKTGGITWEFSVNDDSYAPSHHCSILVEDGVYFAMGEQAVFRLDEKTGEMMWEYHTSGVELSQLYVTSNNRVVVMENIGRGAICLDGETGRVVWESHEECYIQIYGDTLFLRCYDTSKGASNLLVDDSGGITYGDGDFRQFSVYQYQDGILYLGMAETDTLVAFDTRSMTELWRYAPVSAKGRVLVFCQGEAVPATSCHGELFLFEENGIIVAFDMKGGKIWDKELRADEITGFTVYKDQLYVCANDGMVYCFDPMSGSILWNHDTGARVIGHDGKEEVYILGIEGDLMIVYSKFGILVAYSI